MNYIRYVVAMHVVALSLIILKALYCLKVAYKLAVKVVEYTHICQIRNIYSLTPIRK